MAAETWTMVHTTTPNLPPTIARPHTTTDRLLLRPLYASDLDALHKLRTQPEVMRWSAAGRCDTDKEETAGKLAHFLPPSDTSTFNCAICCKETGELIGCGGMHRLNREDGRDGVDTEGGFGWPEVGYMFMKEYWGKGLATEFVTGFLKAWGELERKPIEMKVNKTTLEGQNNNIAVDETVSAREMLVAITDLTNGASQRILEKCGFERFTVFEEKHRENPELTLKLAGYRWFPKIKETK